jgi:predicted N-acetyltransferase YhbS
MEIKIKETNRKEYYTTEYLTRETFWNLYTPGCSEHLVLHQLRKSDSYIGELDLIALANNQIIGHILSTKAKIVDDQNEAHEILCVGPISVLHDFQGKGIGSKLIHYAIDKAKKLGFKGMILFGDPNYYHRFGFKNAKEYKISTRDNKNFDPFMALEFYENSLKPVKGRFFEDEAFEVQDEALKEFEKQFPCKEKGKPKVDIANLK